MLQEISADRNLPGTQLKKIFRHGQWTRPGSHLDHNSPHQRGDVKCRQPSATTGPEGAEDHPQDPRKVHDQHQQDSRVVDLRTNSSTHNLWG